ncbi:MAG: TolC family protein [Bacteroidota bacterium]|nr:TolC family protein [Bacteroidota bacterium]
MKRLILFLFAVAIGTTYPQNPGLGNNSANANSTAVAADKLNAKVQTADSSAEKIYVLTLNDAISIARKNNKDVLIAGQDMSKAEAQIDEAYGNAFPQLDFTAGYQRFFELPSLFIAPNTPFNQSPSTLTMKMGANNSFSTTLSLSQVLFSAKLNSAIEAAKEYSKVSESNVQATNEDVELAVKKTFYSVLLAKNVVDVSRQSLDLAKANYENVSQLYKQGMAAEFDFLRSEVQVANTEPALSQAENNLVLALNALKNLLGIDISKKIALQGALEMEEVPAGVIESESKMVLERNSTLKGLQAQEQLLEKSIQIQKADYYPSLAAIGQYQYQSQDNTFKFSQYNWASTFVVGLQLSFPIFNGMQTKYRVEQAQIDKDKLVLNRQKFEDGLKIQIENAKLKMSEAKQRIGAQVRSVEQATKAVSIAEVRFKNGLGTQVELIDAQVALTRTQINKAQAVYDYLVSKSDWERLSGYKK